MTDSNIGRILSNRYQLVGRLGQGAMGQVYEAKDTLLGGVPVAVKFLAQTLLNQKMRDRFEREATTSALLGQRSIHIVRVTDYGVDDKEVPYYIMEYLRGENLSDVISRQSINLPRFLNLVRQICLGLQCAHQGIALDGETYPVVHRDIKPSNILVIQDPSLGELAKILDFGIAKMLQTDEGQTGSFMGTLAYSSPEQMEGRELDARSDIYSLGIMMFQMLTGKLPLHADTHTFGGWYKAHHSQPPRKIEEANSSVRPNKSLDNLIMSCLAKSPGDRPQNIAAILEILKPLEQRYGPGQKIGKTIGDVIDKVRITPSSSAPPTLSPTQICRLAQWPSDKPLAEIVFFNHIRTSKETLATLWVMLTRQELNKRLICTRYNQFLFMPTPHPAILWLTVLYRRDHGPRWLPCYLDLKTLPGQQMAQLLGKVGQYHLLFFAQEEPQRCAHTMISTIAAAQCKRIQEWVLLAKTSPQSSQFDLSKSYLKSELERLKPEILLKLESLYVDATN